MKITEKDKHNLLDIFHMNFDIKTIKLNGLSEWYNDFFNRIELHCCPELTSNAEKTSEVAV